MDKATTVRVLAKKRPPDMQKGNQQALRVKAVLGSHVPSQTKGNRRNQDKALLTFGLGGALVTVSDRETSKKGRPGSFLARRGCQTASQREGFRLKQASVRWATAHDQPAVRPEKSSHCL